MGDILRRKSNVCHIKKRLRSCNEIVNFLGRLQDRHGVAVGEEPVFFGNGFLIGVAERG